MSDDRSYIRYSDSVETKQPDEDELIEKIVASMARVNTLNSDKHRHGIRDAHAKSHGILKGTLTVYDGLSAELRQGLFAEPKTYDIVARLSTAPGDLQSDRVPTPRGFALKILGVEGAKILPEHAHETTQDLLMVNFPTIAFGHVAAYWKVQNLLEKRTDDSELAKLVTADVARGASKALGLLGVENKMLDALGGSSAHILGETFHSMAAIRYGDFIAKLSAAPLSDEVKKLTGVPVDATDKPSALRDLVVAFFAEHGADYELRAQLCTDPERMPIEDASVEWPTELSPHQPIAKISFPKQDAYSPARRVYGDDVLSFNPWHCLDAHRPLGSIMRVRIKAYESSSRYRHEMNVRPRVEPRTISEIPE